MTPPRHLGPLGVLIGCLLPVFGALAVNSIRLGLIGVAVEAVALGWLLRDLRGTGWRLLLGGIAAASITLSTWLYGGHHLDTSVGAGLRIVYIVLPAALLTPMLRPSALGDHLAQRLHLPARAVVGSVAALQRLGSLGEQWQQVQRARRARGLGLDGGPMRRVRGAAASAFALLVVSMRHAGAMAVAMDARGFAQASRRSWAEPAPWQWGDWLVLALASMLAVLPWWLRYA
ncbi:MAG: energy-coupling factor transporter transmembrane component T family protein [Nocardioidaceae bacterium]